MINIGLKREKYMCSFTAVETHTVGEPTRIITSGFPKCSGNTMMEKKNYLEKHCDCYRSALMCEPRGHKDMVGAVIFPPTTKKADIGVVYMDANRWINMCGHASIGCATYAVEAGVVPVTEPYTTVVLDTPAGLVETKVLVENNRARETTIFNVPSFLYADSIQVTIEGKEIEVAVSFGGSFFALVNAAQLELELTEKDVAKLLPFTKKLLSEVNSKIKVKHPQLEISRVVNAEYYLTKDKLMQRNIVISEEGQVDRSPCGTGTSAKLAYLYSKGMIFPGETFINENFTGARFKGMVEKELSIGSYRAIRPQITGSAYISGESVYLIDPDDPLKYGFSIEG